MSNHPRITATHEEMKEDREQMLLEIDRLRLALRNIRRRTEGKTWGMGRDIASLAEEGLGKYPAIPST